MDNDKLRKARSLIAAEALHELGIDGHQLYRLTGLQECEAVTILDGIDEIKALEGELLAVAMKQNRYLTHRVWCLEARLVRAGLEVPCE